MTDYSTMKNIFDRSEVVVESSPPDDRSHRGGTLRVNDAVFEFDRHGKFEFLWTEHGDSHPYDGYA